MEIVKAEELKMQVIHKRTEAERLREYRQRKGSSYQTHHNTRRRDNRAEKIPEFICIDGEGEGNGPAHKYVLLSSYDKHGQGEYTTNPRGLSWQETFEFLYKQFERNPKASFVGFYLGYDFNRTLANLPEKAAYSLLTKEGKASRLIKDSQARRNKYRSVKVDRWEVDTLGLKRLQIRPRPQNCTCYEDSHKCDHVQLPWMYICDSGPFYQMAFLKVIESDNWRSDPDGWPVTQEEFDTILRGKNDRNSARLGPEMIAYNRLENIVHSRVMERLAKGFQSFGIMLAKDQWYGPGAVASRWLAKHDAPKRTQLRQKHDGQKPLMPKWFWENCHHSYYGGWFEIFSHGLILGESWNYDIHNAYPYAITKLPHICRECQYKQGTGSYRSNGIYVLLYATVYGNNTRIGPVPYRNKAGSILRPSVSKGWYWLGEIDAAKRAGIVKRVVTHEWNEFIPCNHPAPFVEVEELYYKRLKVGSHGAQGMAIKNNNNSIYGKFAQSIGAAPYNNWFYASYITAHCRMQILDSIATHPGGVESVLMVATDGICFDSPHTTLPLTEKLGDWEEEIYTDLCLFKPGVYWHREGKERLAKVKSRGVPKEEFQKAISKVEPKFQRFIDEKKIPGWNAQWAADHIWGKGENAFDIWIETDGWPRFTIEVNFRMKTCLQALHEHNWNTAGLVMEKVPLGQDSNPHIKRNIHSQTGVSFNTIKNRIDSTIHTLEIDDRQTYYHGEVKKPQTQDLGFGLDGETAFSPILEAATILRGVNVNYDFPINDPDNEIEWVTIWG
jgi:DNA polymerase type B, organellar and viral